MASWMALWLGVAFINPPANIVLLILKENKTQLIIDCIMFMFRALSLFFGAKSGDIIYTIILYSSVGVIFNSLLVLIAYFKLNNIKYKYQVL